MMANRLQHKWQYNDQPLLDRRQMRMVGWLLAALLALLCSIASFAQTGIQDLNFQAQSEFQPTIKDAVKLTDIPEIRDSVKRITNLSYPITSVPLFPKYQVQPIDAAKMRDEPLGKLYHALMKVGYGPIYNMPYGELWAGSTRSREASYGLHFRHLSSSATLDDVGFSGFSENQGSIRAKKFYRKHTLLGELEGGQNTVHYYGYDAHTFTVPASATRQQYTLIAPRVELTSHHVDSTHMNNRLGLGYYNLQSRYKESENNIRFDGTANLLLNRERLNVGVLADYYNLKQPHDTLDNFIAAVRPSFEAHGKKWKADVGFNGTLDNWKSGSKFYFYPVINLYYDIYESLVIPYAGVDGSLIKNSFRKYSTENPFIDSSLEYRNTSRQYDIFGGLKGNLSSLTSYDVKVSYANYNNLYFYSLDYSRGEQNRFRVLYDDAKILTLSGQVKYQLGEKINLSMRGNYYRYQTKTLVRAFHRPDYDAAFTASYNLKSKFIIRGELFVLGPQWALFPSDTLLKPKQIKAWADVNLEAEYRYTKMLSFFVRFNNIANQRYYRWSGYPSQRFGFMVGLSFVPF